MGIYVGLILVAQMAIGDPVWKVAPDILICQNSRVKPQRVEKALDFWRPMGHSFGHVSVALSDNMYCVKGEPPYGTIMIDIPGQDFKFSDHLGSTKTWWRTDTGEILKAKIEIKVGWEYTERILEHEIGHAIGFSDNSITGHIMNKAWTRGGNKKKGLQHQKQN